MREHLSKRTKSRRVSPSATPKQAPKQSSSKAAKTLPRQKTTDKVASKQSSLKASTSSKSPSSTKVLNKKKSIALPNDSSKKKTALVKKPVAVTSAPVISKKKSEKNASPKTVKLGNPEIKSSVKRTLVATRITKASPKSTVISRHQMAMQALRAFEQAVKVFNLRDFSEAKIMFEKLQQQYHEEVEIIARSQTYIQVCNVRLAGNRTLPRNADEFYDRGVVALNVGNFVQARTLFERALKLRPGDSYTLYSLAATLAQVGSTEQALTYLEQAVQKQPRLRQQALNDTDFSPIREDRRFLELLGATSPFDLLEARREIS